MSWAGGFITGLCVGIPLWGSLGALAIVLVMSSGKGGDQP